jgi:hypothetical protein
LRGSVSGQMVSLVYIYPLGKRINFLGIFLFAKLVMNNLAKQPNRRRFQTEIDAARLPSELNEAYVAFCVTILLMR